MKGTYLEPEDELYFDSGKQAERALQTSQLIIEYGGTMDRWRGLIIRSKAARPSYDAIGLINSGLAPALRFLSFTWGCDRPYRDHPPPPLRSPEDQAELDTKGKTGESYSLTCGPRFPQLAHVELVGLPSRFVFLRTSPIVSNLTRLKFAGPLSSIESLSNLLSRNPRLESLCIHIGTMGPGLQAEHLDPATLDRLRVPLPLLREFSLELWQHWVWGTQLLQIIDAPNVESFELNFDFQPDYSHLAPIYGGPPGDWSIPRYLAKGRLHNALQSLSSPGEHIGCGPIFPMVRKLNVADIINSISFGPPENFSELLIAFPNITHLVTGLRPIEALLSDPQTHPNLKHITFHTPRGKNIRRSYGIIARYALAREYAGLPISTLHIHTETPESFFETTEPKSSKIKAVNAAIKKEKWGINDSILVLYSTVNSLIVQRPELRPPSWLIDGTYGNAAELDSEFEG